MFLFLGLASLRRVGSQSCLSNPPSISHSATNDDDVEWDIIEDGIYETTVTFDAKMFDKDDYSM